MHVVIINKSDDRGGAAVVSRRLMHALRSAGIEADMLVCEKLTDDPRVHTIASPLKLKIPFLAERLQIFTANGFNRRDLFKADTASFGINVLHHPLVQRADAVILGWVNQGMLSLHQIQKLAQAKPLLWVMHDLWCATGICHHPGTCTHFRHTCGLCPLLGQRSPKDLSYKTFRRKKQLYAAAPIHFIAVSNWLASRCLESPLIPAERLHVIHNPVQLPPYLFTPRPSGSLHMLMSAARLDDPIKGLPTLLDALHILRNEAPDLFATMELTMLGSLKDHSYKDRFAALSPLKVHWVGSVPAADIAPYYHRAHLLLSPSHYETLPGTLVEAQVYGALPVAFHSGGQRDIITSPRNGILARYSTEGSTRARSFAVAIVDAARLLNTIPAETLSKEMYDNVNDRFSADSVATSFINLINNITPRPCHTC